ncbi:hypothetical protein TPA0905_75290 [Streptomyces olivaceus]|nr:hypothetical protein TPA0905_75290 [Streptomyces olivaceus]
MTDRSASAQALALTGGLLATWDALHPLFGQWQGGRDAANKGAFGHHLVYRDGTRAIGAVAAVTTAWLTIRALRKVRAA